MIFDAPFFNGIAAQRLLVDTRAFVMVVDGGYHAIRTPSRVFR
jgi:hypothetical protein